VGGHKADTPHEVTNNVKNNKRQRSADTPTVELIVRRGALRRFDKLKRATAELPVKLSWDRRLGERRTSAGDVSRERRQSDRRKKPPFTWGTADFVVVERPARGSARATAKSKRR
jgi:hypothetical protein